MFCSSSLADGNKMLFPTTVIGINQRFCEVPQDRVDLEDRHSLASTVLSRLCWGAVW